MSHIIDVLMPCVSGHLEMYRISRQAVDTCTRTAGHFAKITLLDNGPDHPGMRSAFLRDDFAAYAKSYGHDYVYDPSPFNESRLYNIGAQMTLNSGAQYIAFANCDLIFHPMWLSGLIRLWEHHKDCYCVVPYSGSDVHHGICYRPTSAPPENVLRLCDHPSNWFMVFRKNDHPVWDESMTYWNADDCVHEWMKAHGKKCGVAYNSRVDHLGDAVKAFAPANFGFDVDAHRKEASEAFDRKWRVK